MAFHHTYLNKLQLGILSINIYGNRSKVSINNSLSLMQLKIYNNIGLFIYLMMYRSEIYPRTKKIDRTMYYIVILIIFQVLLLSSNYYQCQEFFYQATRTSTRYRTECFDIFAKHSVINVHNYQRMCFLFPILTYLIIFIWSIRDTLQRHRQLSFSNVYILLALRLLHFYAIVLFQQQV